MSRKDDPSAWEGFLERYKRFSYQSLGRTLDLKYDMNRLKLRLSKGDVNMSPGMYLSMMLYATLFSAAAVLIISILVFRVMFNVEGWPLFTASLFAVSLLVTIFSYPLIISSRISKKKSEIDKELPFTMSELSILASTGLSPVQIMRKISQRKDSKYMSREFRKIIYHLDVEGKDIITAISETAKETPSQHLREMLWDFSNMIHEGGDMDTYLRNKADASLKLKRDIQKEFIEGLGTLMEIYTSLVLMGILFAGVAAFLMETLASTFNGIDASTLLIIMTYFLIPFSVIAMNLFISASYAKVD
ncbi:MAG: type II secretion system F family protein [Candidatus Thermoplasmatota archaeon]|nr:type II secretion system F family protein [Candidatus Thermoplasmatota archaeon]